MIIRDLDHLDSLAGSHDGNASCLLKGGEFPEFTLPKINLLAMVQAYSLPNPIGTGVDSAFLGQVQASGSSLLKTFSNYYVRAVFIGPQ